MKNSNKKTIILLIISIFFVVFFQTVVYSAFSESLDVNGKAYARLATDVRITDFKISEKYTSTNSISNYEEFSRNNISTSITFNDTGTVYYDVEVTNYNANMIGIYSVSGLPAGVSYSFLDYDLGEVLLDGLGKTTFTICFSASGSYEFDFNLDFRTAYSITYNDFDMNSYPNIIFENEEKVIDFGSEEVNDVSMVVNGSEYTNFVLENNKLIFGPVFGNVSITKIEDVIKIVSGDLNTIGSEVSIGDEHFYIISSNSDSLVMLTKYNLFVGNECTSTSSSSCTDYGTSATGLQNSEMLGYVSGQSVRKGTMMFSSSKYWSSSSYPKYVYNSSSTVYNHVQNYKTYLESQGLVIQEARLIKVEELETLKCSMSDCSCADAPSWVDMTSYWTGAAYSSSYMWYVVSDGGFNYYSNTISNRYGVRPVIVISKSEI